MPTQNFLRQSHSVLGATAYVHRAMDENRLAECARSQELAHGKVIHPRPIALSMYIPYAAAKPVAAHTGGLRISGFAASAAWGASLTVSMARTDLPLLSLYWIAYLRLPLPQLYPRQAGARPTFDWTHPNDKTRRNLEIARICFTALPYASFALAGWEAFIGTDALPSAAALAQHQARPRALPWRRTGAMGFLEATLLQKADAAHDAGTPERQTRYLALAVGLRLVLAPLRLASAAAVAGIALVGVGVGLAYEATAQAIFYGYLLVRWLMRSPQQAVPMQVAVQRQYGAQAQDLRDLDDTVLNAPLANALWRQGRDEPVLFNNRWVSLGAAASLFYGRTHGGFLGMMRPAEDVRRAERARAALMHALFGVPAPGGRPAPGAAVPEGAEAAAGLDNEAEARAYARGVDVHDRGRDPAMRASLSHLLQLYPNVNEAAAITALQAEVNRHEHSQTDFARRPHEQGGTLLQAAKQALGPDQGRAPGGWPAVLATGNQHAVRLDDGTLVAVRRVCATVWHAVEQLEDPRGEPLQHEVLRAERKEALLAAIADCMNAYGSRVCGPGQAQRMLLVLQGTLEGVHIENYEEVPPVAQMVTYVYGRIVADLAEEPTAVAVQAAYDAGYAEATTRLPPQQHAELRDSLAQLALIDHEYTWAPQA